MNNIYEENKSVKFQSSIICPQYVFACLQGQ